MTAKAGELLVGEIIPRITAVEPERILTTNDCFENHTAYCNIQNWSRLSGSHSQA